MKANFKDLNKAQVAILKSDCEADGGDWNFQKSIFEGCGVVIPPSLLADELLAAS